MDFIFNLISNSFGFSTIVLLLVLIIVLLFWLILLRAKASRNQSYRKASLTNTDLEDYARKIAVEHSVSSKKSLVHWPIPRLNDNYSLIHSVYKNLNDDIQKKRAVPSSAEWLLDNFYIVEEQVKSIRRDLSKKSYSQLPILKTGALKGHARVFAVAMELVLHTDGQMDETTLLNYLKAYQSHSILFDREIWAIPIVMRLAIIENIRHICEKIKNTQAQWHKADEIVDIWINNDGDDSESFLKTFKSTLKSMDETNPSYIEHLYFSFRRSGFPYNKFLRVMDESLEKRGTSTEKLTQKEHLFQSVNTISLGNCITSLKYFSSLDWSDLFESASYVEQILRQDPDGTYPLMDIQTRNFYRSKIEKLAIDLDVSELLVAREAIELAVNACTFCKVGELDDSQEVALQRTRHVGYYLIGQGIKELEKTHKISKNNSISAADLVSKYPSLLYIGTITTITLFLSAIAFRYSMISSSVENMLLFLFFSAIVFIPSSEIAVSFINWIVCKTLTPAIFPRLELKNGIPQNLSTIIVIPSLIPDKKRVKELLSSLEGHYLSNRGDNLFFALVGAFKDADDESINNDLSVVNAAIEGVKRLNNKYAKDSSEKFFFFHRSSHYNKSNNKWIGWERKRGAIIEFNDLVLGKKDTTFAHMSNENPPFENVKYIITLDSDTMLPMEMAKKLIGTMAHPLNMPVIDNLKGVVTSGYALMQPRIDFDSESSNASLFSKIYTGQQGIDPYANAISDVYQDLFGEGIFTGKGIYDLKVFQTVLRNAIPDNTILSHDLLEGSYLRTALVTDTKLVDSYPSKYNSHAARLHRWVRGDWQLLPLLFSKIFNFNRSSRIKNPLSLLSRWKMLDNLRRSLIAPSLMVLLALSFSFLPGNCLFWIAYFIISLIIPLVTGMISTVASGRFGSGKIKKHIPVIFGLKATLYQILLTFVFLPHQAYLMINAVSVTLCRLITRKNLLEWVTAADTERIQKNSLKSYYRKMHASIWMPLGIAILTFLFKQTDLTASLILLVIWMFSPYIAYKISEDSLPPETSITSKDMNYLRILTRKTWRYFEEFANFKSHYLAPDNYQEDPPRGVAYRTSPTNIGMGLMAIISARDFGYISTTEMIEMISNTVSTIERLDLWNGHLLNWYDTRTLKPLRPRFISTVDSGNFVSYLITLQQGLEKYLWSPILSSTFLKGIQDTMSCSGEDGTATFESLKILKELYSNAELDIFAWKKALDELNIDDKFAGIKTPSWRAKTERMLRMLKKELFEYMSWVELAESCPPELKESDQTSAKFEKLMSLLLGNPKLKNIPKTYDEAISIIDSLTNTAISLNESTFSLSKAWLSELRTQISSSKKNVEKFIEKFELLIESVNRISENTKFTPLYVPKKQLFSIGYNLEDEKLVNSYYDLLASEARQTSYVAIARGEIQSSHWFNMGRALTVIDGYKGLVSWTGTMFEYLMPLLLMKPYKNTLLDETYSFVIKSQKKYGRQRNMPWGTSESAFNSMDINLDYQYKAIGVPWLGLKRGLIEDAVTSPYSTMLALLVDPESAFQNIKHLKAEGLEGPYGLYEAADYTKQRLPFETKRAVIKSFMAHHQGMSLMALNNFLNNNVMQKRFFSDPAINAARLLLQERVPTNLLFTKETKEKVRPFKGVASKEASPIRMFSQPNPILPKVHVLSNGNYSVMLTDRGTGFSKNKVAAISRWREDSTLDQFGMFFYIRNIETNKFWSNTFAPLNVIPKKYEAIFTGDKAIFRRTDEEIITTTEVVVASVDNVEIRRITLKNQSDNPVELELTSYFEVVLATLAADIAHPAFSNLFVNTEIHPEKRSLFATRKSRSESDKELWISNSIVFEGNIVGTIQFETDKMQLLGRGNNTSNPITIAQSKPLTNSFGPVLDPVMCTRFRLKILAGKSAEISYVISVGESSESISSQVSKYSTQDSVEKAFQLALTRSQVETRFLNIDAQLIELYQNMMSNLFFISPEKTRDQALIIQNTKGQSSLWAYGISGDKPIVLVIIDNLEEGDFLNEVLEAHEYWWIKELNVDLVVLTTDEDSYNQPLFSLANDIVASRQNHDVLSRQKDIFILDRGKISQQDLALFFAVARIVLRGSIGDLKEQVISEPVKILPQTKKFSDEVFDFRQTQIREPSLTYFNGIGGFNLEGREYIMKLEEGQNTPTPWVNVIANPKFGFIVSESGSGYSWAENSRENKLSPWSNDPVGDSPGEIIYISDAINGEVWTPTALPIRDSETYVARHGFGYSSFKHNSHGIDQRLVQFVPVDDPIKISILGLKNSSSSKRTLTLTYFIRPVLGVSDQATALHIKTSRSDSGSLLIENPYNEDFANRIAFVDCSLSQRNVTGDRKEFFGDGGILSPDCLKREGLSNSIGIGFDPCAAMQVTLTLKPNENREVVFLFGSAESHDEVKLLTDKYRKLQEAKEALWGIMKFWEVKLDIVRVNAPNVSMNLMLNGWLEYQVISCRLWARSGFYQSGGAFGFRDQLQDSMSIAHIWPELTRKQILLHASHQFVEGDVQHWWHEPTGKGTRTRFSDDLLWLPYVTAEYIKTTGDLTILNEQVGFIQDAILVDSQDEKYGTPSKTDFTASLFEHCIKAIERSLKVGTHGIPLMGSGDWNDGMNTVGNKGLGESVWLGWFLISVLDKFIPLCSEMAQEEKAQKYLKHRNKLADSIEKNAWDGDWYRRAYFDNGTPLGSVQNTECKIDSISQTWSIISGAGTPEKVERAMRALEDHLIDRRDGIIKLLMPPFENSDLEPGYIKGYVPGVRENGGQYTHAAAWVIIAFAKLGDGDKAMEMFELINPINHSHNLREYSRYKVEPYVVSADVYAVHPHIGRGGWSWYTGSAGWVYKAGVEYLLGFQKNGNTIIMDPCIPKRWEEYSISYKHLSAHYNIRVHNPEQVCKGIKSMLIDGDNVPGNIIPLLDDGKTHFVEITLGQT
ncbi:MAG: glucoamylase family protein [Bacillota bacterium]